MEIMRDPAAFQERCFVWRAGGAVTALVPTMGFFHEGHLSLMRHAREAADKVMVSLFVNPAQFGPSEDLEAYPRDPDADAAKAEAAGADVLFMPEAGDMYPAGFGTVVEVPALARRLCGASRPGHFRGVATVVAKLLVLAMPTMAVFGEKDWQQLALIRRMALDLGLPTRIVGRPVAREPSGLAMSSRNTYLSGHERARAAAIRAGMLAAGQWAGEGERDVRALLERLVLYYASHLAEARVDYLEVVDPDTIEPVQRIEGKALLAGAFFLGKARLIDNILLAG